MINNNKYGCMDAGAATQRKGEVELRLKQQSRTAQATVADDCMDAEGRAPTAGALGDAGAVAEAEQRREQLPRASKLGALANTDRKPVETAIIQPSIKMVRYRLDVGSQHQVTSEELKKVLIEESGVDKNNINNINIQRDYTLVELPDEMPQDIFLHLKSVEIKQRKLDIKRVKARNKKRNNNYSRRGRQRSPASNKSGSNQAGGS